MSSRSLAAARSRRAGENAPPVSGNRPGTSIGSHAAFAPQGYQSNNMQQPPANVRVARGQQMPPNNAYHQVEQSQQSAKTSLPFSKLSISDAIGLITLRLGRVEQWVIETEHENDNKEYSENQNIPENSRVIDNSVLTNMINRLDSLEKKETGPINNEVITKLSEDVSNLTAQITRFGDEGTKHNLAISKHTEQLFKFERELVETKDILKTFMIKYDLFANETNNRFSDFEYALSDLEKSIQPSTDENNEQTYELNDQLSSEQNKETITQESDETSINDNDTNNDAASIMSVDLKNIIKQELASST